MNSAHLAVRDAFAQLLMADPPLADGRIDEQSELSLPQGIPSSVQVFRDSSSPQALGIRGAPIDWTTRIRVLCKARTTAAGSAELVADSLAGEVFARVSADPSLKGLADDTSPDAISWDQDEADTAVAVATLTFVVLHRTAGHSINS